VSAVDGRCGTILDEETFQWIDAAEQLPDADTTVLVFAPESSEAVWLGYFDGEGWHSVEGMPYAAGAVKAWASMLRGPVRGQ